MEKKTWIWRRDKKVDGYILFHQLTKRKWIWKADRIVDKYFFPPLAKIEKVDMDNGEECGFIFFPIHQPAKETKEWKVASWWSAYLSRNICKLHLHHPGSKRRRLKGGVYQALEWMRSGVVECSDIHDKTLSCRGTGSWESWKNSFVNYVRACVPVAFKVVIICDIPSLWEIVLYIATIPILIVRQEYT